MANGHRRREAPGRLSFGLVWVRVRGLAWGPLCVFFGCIDARGTPLQLVNGWHQPPQRQKPSVLVPTPLGRLSVLQQIERFQQLNKSIGMEPALSRGVINEPAADESCLHKLSMSSFHTARLKEGKPSALIRDRREGLKFSGAPTWTRHTRGWFLLHALQQVLQEQPRSPSAARASPSVPSL